jgi:hypothetical protein
MLLTYLQAEQAKMAGAVGKMATDAAANGPTGSVAPNGENINMTQMSPEAMTQASLGATPVQPGMEALTGMLQQPSAVSYVDSGR